MRTILTEGGKEYYDSGHSTQAATQNPSNPNDYYYRLTTVNIQTIFYCVQIIENFF